MKELPKAIEAEQAILAAIFTDSERAIPSLDGYLESQDFYSQRHRAIYDAAKGLFIAGDPVDVVSVSERLEQTNKLDQAGGHLYLSEIVEHWATPEAVEHYAGIVRSKAWRRRLVSCGSDLSELGYACSQDNELEESVGNILKSVMLGDTHANEMADLAGVGSKYLKRVEEMRGHHWHGVPTGFKSLDNILNGLEGQLTIVAGSPSMGKSLFLLNMAYQQARRDVPVGIISLEMSSDPIFGRLIQRHRSWNEETLRYAKMDDLKKAASELAELPLWISVSDTQSIAGILEKMRRMVVREGVRSIILDYVQLLGGNNTNRAEELSGIVRQLLLFSKRHPNVAVITGAQINRTVMQSDSKRPKLHHLKSSGGIEEHSDIVLGLFREEYMDNRVDAGVLEVHVLKNRGGRAQVMEKLFCDIGKQKLAELTSS